MKVKYRLVHNRKNNINAQGTALIQIESSLSKKKMYLSTGVYVRQEEWDKKSGMIIGHPHADMLNAFLYSLLIEIQGVELSLWRQGIEVSLGLIKERMKSRDVDSGSFIRFSECVVDKSQRSKGTKQK